MGGLCLYLNLLEEKEWNNGDKIDPGSSVEEGVSR